jgi:carbamoyltransferase
MNFLGLGKTLYQSSAALITPGKERPEITLALSERLLRKKASGAWPEKALHALRAENSFQNLQISENRDVVAPTLKERAMNAGFPFFEHLKAQKLDAFSGVLNPDVQFVTHHLCHAMAATLMSPFSKALVVVVDGAGSRLQDFPLEHPERKFPPSLTDTMSSPLHEEGSVYLLDRVKERPVLTPVMKRWNRFVETNGRHLSEGLGIFYETAAQYIFNDSRAAGKVMGLAPLGKSLPFEGSRVEWLKNLEWENAFREKGKKAWENSPQLNTYREIAATVQEAFEEEMFQWVGNLRERYPDYENLILTGGCALNCTFNGKLFRRGMFSGVYVPPFPGDESIGLGAAAFSYFQHPESCWEPLPLERQQAYFGPRTSAPSAENIEAVFGAKYEVEKPTSITHRTAEVLQRGHVIAWFQGRSESGPRALGHRSLLVRPDKKGIKDFLNARIKFRESFRPYGASCSFSHASTYFDVPGDFHTPYMAFAAPTREEYRARFEDITHTDGTCRFQSVRPQQDQRFFDLIEEFGRLSGIFCLLNTSFNIMGEPIVESVEDARKFLDLMNQQEVAPIHGLAIGDYYIRARGHRE